MSAPNFVSGIEGKTLKVDGGFKENMQRISEAHPNSPMAEKYGTNIVDKEHDEETDEWQMVFRWFKTEELCKKHAELPPTYVRTGKVL